MTTIIDVWVALSAQGYPAPFLGWAYRKKDLKVPPGYCAVKAQLIVKARA